MAGESRGLLWGQVRTLFEAGTVIGLTDGQLLERFATRRGEASELAFTALVERHGPMVLRACRGVLRDDHEAMDAFQATFLVLARKGGSLWVRDSLGPWLHRVACRAAGRARRDAERRRASERKAAEMAKPRIPDADREETAAAIHEEVDRLPERYRAAVVLCDLEGRTCEDAARHLGCPVGTVGSRLARGRERLRDRLARRGLAPRGGLASGLLAWQGPIEPIPPELVGATVAAAARFASSQAASQGAAAFLALGVLRSMSMTTCLKIATVLLAAGASTSGFVAIAGKGPAAAAARPDDPPQAAKVDAGGTVEVKPGKFDITVGDRARLEASRSDDVYSPVEGQTTIISILPEGTRVKKGDLVCELDSAALRDTLANQTIAAPAAEAAYRKAKLAREVAEIALKEYTEGIALSEHEIAAGAVHLAESALKAAEKRLERSRNARTLLNHLFARRVNGTGERLGPGPATAEDVMAQLDIDDRIAAAELDIDRERASVEAKQSNLNLLNNYTKVKITKQLSAEIESARIAEQAAQSAFELENNKSKHLERQVKNCKLYAPNDGILVHANDPFRAAGRPFSRIEEGATVRERQKIFSLPELTKFRAVVTLPESVISQIRPGQAAQVQVDAFPNENLAGIVEVVFPLPDPPRASDSNGKYYTTYVLIEKGLPGLRPGMTSNVRIVVGTDDDVLSVPVSSVIRDRKNDHSPYVAVEKPDGTVEWRNVTLGRANGAAFEVKEGLKPGETIVIDPAPLWLWKEKEKAKGSPQPDATTKPAGKTPRSEGGGR